MTTIYTIDFREYANSLRGWAGEVGVEEAVEDFRKRHDEALLAEICKIMALDPKTTIAMVSHGQVVAITNIGEGGP
jgi:hypothetical protein